VASIISSSPLDQKDLGQKIYNQWIGSKSYQESILSDFLTDMAVAVFILKKKN